MRDKRKLTLKINLTVLASGKDILCLRSKMTLFLSTLGVAARLSLAVGLFALASCSRSGPVTVPFVGCAGDGQVGEVPAPRGEPQVVDLDPALAKDLAFYKAAVNDAASLSVLAPRGWHCFYRYGSSGSILRVAPVDDIDNTKGISVTRPGVVVSLSYGDTSGRFEVATYAARLFAVTRRDFVERVIAEDIEPRDAFPYGPYPADILTYDGPNRVIFETPAGKEGIGSFGKIATAPIYGVVELTTDDDPNMATIQLSLPADLQHLRPAILAKRTAK